MLTLRANSLYRKEKKRGAEGSGAEWRGGKGKEVKRRIVSTHNLKLIRPHQ
jgi:hypothetical protein